MPERENPYAGLPLSVRYECFKNEAKAAINELSTAMGIEGILMVAAMESIVGEQHGMVAREASMTALMAVTPPADGDEPAQEKGE